MLDVGGHLLAIYGKGLCVMVNVGVCECLCLLVKVGV